MTDRDRPAPESFLRAAAEEGRGRLKIFLGAAPGVGKTFEMLAEGAARKAAGVDVVIGVVETHGRAETEALTQGYEIVPRRAAPYEGHTLFEMDIDGLLARHPQLALVDELAHTNAPGSRHRKRYQDVEELLAAGISVYTTVNIQHLESLNDVVASFTHIRVRETVPDSILERAEVEVVDIPPDELIERLQQGKIYLPQEADRALDHFFAKSNLSALRELALRRAAQAVDTQMLDYLDEQALSGTWGAGERIVVAISELPGADELVRAAKRMADALHASWTAVYVETARSRQLAPEQHKRIANTLELAARLGGQVATVPARGVTEGLKTFSAEARATQLIVGKSVRSRWFELRHGSIVDRLVRESPELAVHVLPVPVGKAADSSARHPLRSGHWGAPSSYLYATIMVGCVTLVGLLGFRLLHLGNVALLYLLPVMTAASLSGLRPGLYAGFASTLAYNFFFLPPVGTLSVANPENVVSILVLMGIAVVTSQLTSRVRVQADLAAASARTNAALAAYPQLLARLDDPQEVARTACAEIGRLLSLRVILLEHTPTGWAIQAASDPQVRLDPIDLAAAQWSAANGLPAGRGTGTLAAADWQFRPLRAARGLTGLIGLARDDGADPVPADQLALVGSLLDQTSLVLDRLRPEAAGGNTGPALGYQ